MKKKLLSIGLALTVMFGWQTSTAQSAIDFEELNGQYVEVGTGMNTLLTGTNNITVEGWVKLESSGSFRTVAGNYNTGMQFLLRIDGGLPRFWIDNGGGFQNVTGTTTIPVGAWTHIAGSWDGTTLKVFVNGVLEGSSPISGAFPTVTSSVRVGGSVNNGTELMDGLLDDVRIWSTVRTDSEITNNMASCLTGTETGLLALYDFESATGTTLTDRTGNGYNGTLMNTPLWVAGMACSGTCPIADETVTLVDYSALCYSDTTILVSSTAGVNYYLRDNSTNAIIYGPVMGTGGQIVLYTGAVTSTTMFNVYAEVNEVGAINFDGTDDYVSCGNILAASYTKEAWVYFTAPGLNNNIIAGSLANGQHAFWAPPGYGNRLSSGHNNVWNEVQDPTPITFNTWHHVAVTYDNATGEMILYKDGLLVDSKMGVPAFIGGNLVELGRFNGGNNMQGKMDEARIWNTVRTQAEIQNSMDTCLIGTETGLVAYYKLNDNTGTIAADLSPNGNNGTLVNMNPATSWTVNGADINCPACTLQMTQTPTITINPIADQIFNTADFSAICSADTTIEIASSEIGVAYGLINNADSSFISQGPIMGTGSAIQFSTGAISSTTTLAVYAAVPGTNEVLNFNGANQSVSLGAIADLNLDNNMPFTIESWINLTSTTRSSITTKMRNANAYRGYDFYAENSELNFLLINTWPGNSIFITTNTANLTMGSWQHVAISYDGSGDANNMKVYIDGVPQTFTVNINGLTGTTVNTTDNVIIGARPDVSAYFSGSIDDVRFWSTERTQMEIQDNSMECLSGNELGLEAYYKFQDGTGSSYLADNTVNGINGTLQNMDPATDWVAGNSNLWCPTCETIMPSLTTITINPIADQAVAITDTTVCMVNTGTTVTTTSSEVGVDYYLRDNTNDTIIDGPIAGTGNGLTFNTGVLATNMTYNVEGVTLNSLPSALAFNGVNKSLMVPNAPGLVSTTGQFTAEIWGRSNTPSWNNFGLLMSKRNSYIIHTNSGTNVTFYLTTDGVSAAILYTGITDITVWHHYAMSWDGATLFCYVDGNMVASAPCTGNMVPSTNPLEMGKDNLAGRYLNGDIDDARIWSTYRTPGEILANYNRVLTGSEVGLEMYLPMNDGGGVTAMDITGNGHDGTAVNIVDPTDWIMGPSFVECSAVMSITPSVTVHDILAPVADVTTLTDVTAECSVTSLTAPTATDNCATTITVTNNATLPITTQGTTMVTWTYDDGNGNTSTQTQNVVIADVTNPTITAPADMSVVVNATNCETSGVSLGTETAADNCSTPTVTNDAPTTFPLGATTVTWTATDAVGNTATAMQIVTVTTDLAIASSPVVTNATCNGNTDGAINITVSGGTMAYSYSWDNAATTEDLTGIGAGSYTVTLTDANGCTDTMTISVVEPAVIAATMTSTDVLCNGDANGTASLTFTGGTGTLVSDWGTVDTNALAPGYAVYTVTDANSCVLMDSVLIAEPAVLALTAVGTDEMNGNDGTIDLTVSGGTTTYGYSWDNASTTEDLTGLTAGTYVVTVTDANGCVDSLSIIIDTQVGIEENGISAVIYPNPTSGIVTIEFAQILDGTITVLDGIGKVVLTERITNIKQIIDLSNNERGIYFLQISKGESNTMIKIVLQ